MNAHDVLSLLAETTAASIKETVTDISEETLVKVKNIEVFDDDVQAYHDIEFPLVLARVLYRDAVIGGNLILLSEAGARKLARALVEDDEETEFGKDSLLIAAGQVMNKMMLATAATTSEVLGHDVEISEPESHWIESQDALTNIYSESASTFSTRIELEIFGEPCLIVQLVPKSFIIKMTRALDEIATEIRYDDGRVLPGVPLDKIMSMPVRVSVEFGEARMSFAKASTLSANEVISLQSSTRDPVGIYADGELIAYGNLRNKEGKLNLVIKEILPSLSRARRH
jgi:flagellar motor switch protein FliN/FliY